MPDFTRPPSMEELERLACHRAAYRPPHAAADLGISPDSVNRFLRMRRRSFPVGEPGLKRRTEWSSFEAYLKVLWVLCSLSPTICRRAHQRLSIIAPKKLREKCGKSAANTTAVAVAH